MSLRGEPCPSDESQYDSDSSMQTLCDSGVNDFNIDTDTDTYTDDELMPYEDCDYREPAIQEGQGRPVPKMEWELLEESSEIRKDKFQLIIKSAIFNVSHQMRDVSEIQEFQDEIDNGFHSAVFYLIKEQDPDNYISVSLTNDALEGSVYVPPQKVGSFKKTSFLETIYKLAQSKIEFLLSGTLEVRVRIYKSIKGGGRSKKVPQIYDQEMKKKKRSVVRIQSKGNSCGYCALAMGQMYHELEIKNNSRQTQWASCVKNMSSQIKCGRILCEKYGLEFEKPLDLETIQSVQESREFMNVHQIIVIRLKDGEQIYKGDEANKEIYLLWDEEQQHFDLIKEMNAYVGYRLYCKHCNKGFQQSNYHNCKSICQICRGSVPCKEDGPQFPCKNCGNIFINKNCYETHIKNKLCKHQKFCQNCEVTYRFDKHHKHSCDEFHCNKCNEYYSIQPHYCYLKKLDKDKLHKEDETPKIIVTFDIESMLISSGSNVYDHKPNLVCAQVICTKCWNDKTNTSSSCSIRNIHFMEKTV